MHSCPYCGQDLEEGTFRSRGGNYFLPAGEKAPLFYSEEHLKRKKIVGLPPDAYSLARPEWPIAYLCRHCKKVIIPYE